MKYLFTLLFLIATNAYANGICPGVEVVGNYEVTSEYCSFTPVYDQQTGCLET